MSYSYSNAKKMRKRTKIEQLNTQLAVQKQVVGRLASALVLLKGLADKFADGTRWCSEEEVDNDGNVIGHNYIWNGENDPTEQIKATLNQVMEKLGPLSGMFDAKPTEAPRSNSDAQPQPSEHH